MQNHIKDVLTKYNPKVEKSEIGIINMLCLNLGDIINEKTEILPIYTQPIIIDYAKDIITKKELENLIIKACDKL